MRNLRACAPGYRDGCAQRPASASSDGKGQGKARGMGEAWKSISMGSRRQDGRAPTLFSALRGRNTALGARVTLASFCVRERTWTSSRISCARPAGPKARGGRAEDACVRGHPCRCGFRRFFPRRTHPAARSSGSILPEDVEVHPLADVWKPPYLDDQHNYLLLLDVGAEEPYRPSECRARVGRGGSGHAGDRAANSWGGGLGERGALPIATLPPFPGAPSPAAPAPQPLARESSPPPVQPPIVKVVFEARQAWRKLECTKEEFG
ncbi:hypothetical protein B0H15DRAFT_565360 [Mycena belliarum]|uniref:Uncharacterized protein n=1 Tax=Mycena belliarum TaxID=1033014 RepID=A0AAD6TX17_9AGAR|nr:hypothetical protein B0H15DRAFT_565360 [Mycena belliae]